MRLQRVMFFADQRNLVLDKFFVWVCAVTIVTMAVVLFGYFIELNEREDNNLLSYQRQIFAYGLTGLELDLQDPGGETIRSRGELTRKMIVSDSGAERIKVMDRLFVLGREGSQHKNRELLIFHNFSTVYLKNAKPDRAFLRLFCGVLDKSSESQNRQLYILFCRGLDKNVSYVTQGESGHLERPVLATAEFAWFSCFIVCLILYLVSGLTFLIVYFSSCDYTYNQGFGGRKPMPYFEDCGCNYQGPFAIPKGWTWLVFIFFMPVWIVGMILVAFVWVPVKELPRLRPIWNRWREEKRAKEELRRNYNNDKDLIVMVEDLNRKKEALKKITDRKVREALWQRIVRAEKKISIVRDLRSKRDLTAEVKDVKKEDKIARELEEMNLKLDGMVESEKE